MGSKYFGVTVVMVVVCVPSSMVFVHGNRESRDVPGFYEHTPLIVLGSVNKHTFNPDGGNSR